jgi:hypothetical protein
MGQNTNTHDAQSMVTSEVHFFPGHSPAKLTTQPTPILIKFGQHTVIHYNLMCANFHNSISLTSEDPVT